MTIDGVDYALEITGMEKFREENPYNLPLSTRKFVTIAAIIAMNTEVMIFDEPTAGQDLEGNIRLGNILKELHRQGKTVIRLDTWEHNTPANRLYPSLGYRFAGATEFFFMGFVREILNCYEKAL